MVRTSARACACAQKEADRRRAKAGGMQLKKECTIEIEGSGKASLHPRDTISILSTAADPHEISPARRFSAEAALATVMAAWETRSSARRVLMRARSRGLYLSGDDADCRAARCSARLLE